MPKDDVLKDRERERGESMDTLIPALLKKYDGRVFRVAVELGVYPNTIRNWLLGHGYSRNPDTDEWLKAEPTTETDSAA